MRLPIFSCKIAWSNRFRRVQICDKGVVLSLLLCLLSAACVSPDGRNSQTRIDRKIPLPSENSIAVVGVTARSGLKLPLNLDLMVGDFEAVLKSRDDFTVFEHDRVRQQLGAGLHDDMMAHYARNGRLAPYQIRTLVEADLPARRAIVVRLDTDNVEELPVRSASVLDETGETVTSRDIIIRSFRRVTTLSAVLVDLRSGQIMWTRRLVESPEVSHVVTQAEAGAESAAETDSGLESNANNETRLQPPELIVSVRSLLSQLVLLIPPSPS